MEIYASTHFRTQASETVVPLTERGAYFMEKAGAYPSRICVRGSISRVPIHTRVPSRRVAWVGNRKSIAGFAGFVNEIQRAAAFHFSARHRGLGGMSTVPPGLWILVTNSRHSAALHAGLVTTAPPALGGFVTHLAWNRAGSH